MKGKGFQKRVEDFRCENCGEKVKGKGYTNHCPKCLWSKHVDISPGDRKESCQGLMEPLGTENKGGDIFIHYRCLRCKYRHRVKRNPEDNEEEIIKLSGEKL